jgi:hypothetical protein
MIRVAFLDDHPAARAGYSIGYLANTLPVPGGIGVLDAGLSGALLLYGASPAHVIAAVLVYHAVSFWIPSLGGLIAYARLRPRLTDLSSDDPPSSPSSSLTHASNPVHQEVSDERTPADPQTNRPRMGRVLDRQPGGRSLPWSWFEGRETVRLGSGSRFAGPAPSRRLGVPRRLAVASLALGCVLSLLAPNQSSASSLVVPRETHAGSPQSHRARHAQVPPHLTDTAPSRPDVPSTADGASVLVLLVLALNSAAMVIRLVGSPPSWIKD